jgi:hypothetical protein
MVDVKGRFLTVLSQSTVFTTVARAEDDLSSQSGRD